MHIKNSTHTLYITPAHGINISPGWKLLPLFRNTDGRHVAIKRNRRREVQNSDVVVPHCGFVESWVSLELGDNNNLRKENYFKNVEHISAAITNATELNENAKKISVHFQCL